MSRFALQEWVLNFLERRRLGWVNRHPSIKIASPGHFALSAKINYRADGWHFGGKLTVEKNCKICQGVILAPYGGPIEIGENVFIGPYCVLYGQGGLKIGANTQIAAHSVIIPSNHVFTDLNKNIREQGTTNQGITIEENCWLGCGVQVLDGVTIGHGSVIGAGAVVTKSILPNSIAVGVPARVVKTRN